MEKEQWEHLSIGLETMAFFFVTIDLYGKERLSLLRSKVVSFNSVPIKDRAKNLVWKMFKRWYLFLFVIILINILISQIILRYYSAKFISLYKTGTSLQTINLDLNIIVFTSTIFLYALFNFMFLVPFYLVVFIQKMSKLFRFEGMMLAIGTILFIISKVIAYGYV